MSMAACKIIICSGGNFAAGSNETVAKNIDLAVEMLPGAKLDADDEAKISEAIAKLRDCSRLSVEMTDKILEIIKSKS